MEFLNGSGKNIDTVFPDSFHFFELLAMLVDEEPGDIFGPLERFQMQSIGIEKGKALPSGRQDKSLAVRGGANRRSDSPCQHV